MVTCTTERRGVVLGLSDARVRSHVETRDFVVVGRVRLGFVYGDDGVALWKKRFQQEPEAQSRAAWRWLKRERTVNTENSPLNPTKKMREVSSPLLEGKKRVTF